MHTTAFAVADQDCRPVPAKAIVEKREELERARLQASALPSTPVSEAYLGLVDQFLAIQAPLSDPIVERRPPTRKGIDGSARDYAHARGVCARVQEEGRRIFGKAGDRVTDVFVSAATGVFFSRDDRRARFKR
jgi:hypothetical protein